MCELHGVTRSGFYAWCTRKPSQRQQDDQVLMARVRQIHADSRGFYGSPGVAGQLRQDGHSVGRRRVARLMRQAGLQGALGLVSCSTVTAASSSPTSSSGSS
jgi:transposase InsO family protein